ncbi:hypothetical protein MYX82_03445 [Acidobacteria bacterium AH-259-D05]|nr:hypothetical protein [Acidobacteria bacterium AH-259-D05]
MSNLENPTIQITVKRDNALPTITEKEFNKSAKKVLQRAREGHQVAIVNAEGKIKEVIGINGRRLLPEPDSDLVDRVIEFDKSQDDDSPIEFKW